MPETHHLAKTSTIAFSLIIAASLFLHGMQLEKSGGKALALPVAMATYKAIQNGAELSDAAHTHVERGSLAEAIHHLSYAANSRMLPRDDHRKHILSKKVVKGVHPFDGYHLPSHRA